VFGAAAATVVAVTKIGSGFPERTDQVALVIGPTGVGLGPNGTLYVADTLDNRIAAIPDAAFRVSDDGTGTTVSENGALNGPLGLAIAPGGDILTANGGDGNLVETTPGGAQVAVQALDTTPTPPFPPGNGALFGLAVAPQGTGVYFVDDDSNTLNLLN
jgi:DNA-binding beta-propeller fold protein YncE